MRAVLLALLLCGLFAAPAQAGARGDAKRVVRILDAMYDSMPDAQVQALGERIEAEMEGCAAQPPDTEATLHRQVSLYLRHATAEWRDQLRRAGRKLRAFRSGDRGVRRLARAMGRSLLGILPLGTDPPAPCPYFEAWKAAGWSAGFRIDPPVRNLSASEVAAMQRDSRLIARTLKRLRALGVPRRTVQRLREEFVDDAGLLANLSL